MGRKLRELTIKDDFSVGVQGEICSNRVISVIFSVILNQRTSSTLQSSALKSTEISAVEVCESRRDKI